MARVLIVDDHPINLKLLDYALRSEGLEVVTAEDGEQALAQVLATRPDLILMDLQMPKIGGLELTQRLKADQATCAIPIVAVTAYAMKGDQQRALAAGCDGYLSKPVDLQTLRQIVRRFLGP